MFRKRSQDPPFLRNIFSGALQEHFVGLTVPGFLLLIFGSSLYNEVLRLPSVFKYDKVDTVPARYSEASPGAGDEEGGRGLEEALALAEDDHESEVQDGEGDDIARPLLVPRTRASPNVIQDDSVFGSYTGTSIKMREESR